MFVWIMRLQRQQELRRAWEEEQSRAQEAARSAAGQPTPEAQESESKSPPETGTPESAPEPQEVLLAGPDLEYEVVFTNVGAAIRNARLSAKKYPATKGGNVGVQILEAMEGKPPTLAILDPKGNYPFDAAPFVLENRDRAPQDPVVFHQTFGKLDIRKEFIPRPGKPEIGVRVTIANLATADSAAPVFARYEIVAAGRVKPEGDGYVILRGACGFKRERGKVGVEFGLPQRRKWWPFGNTRPMPYFRESHPQEAILWAGAVNKYFAAILRADDSPDARREEVIQDVRMELLPSSDSIGNARGGASKTDNVYVLVEPRPVELAPGESVTHEYTLFLGPKLAEVLAPYGDMEGLMDYGTFGAISRLLLVILKAFYRVCGNFGVSIILLTILVKACLHPLTRKSQISMHKMQKLQPLIREIQEKYKGDKQKQTQAQMELLRRHGANPMGGCWPILFQIPVFFGLFRMLQQSLELRHAGFVLWIKDLSRPDTIAVVWGFPINILPVLMVISWVIQSMTQPKSPDPEQAKTQKMMMFMPIVFGFMLYGMASGLTLYWLTSTFLGILEQKWVKHQIEKMEAAGAFAAEEQEVAAAQPSPNRKRGRRK